MNQGPTSFDGPMAMSHFHSVGYETATSILQREWRFNPVVSALFHLGSDGEKETDGSKVNRNQLQAVPE